MSVPLPSAPPVQMLGNGLGADAELPGCVDRSGSDCNFEHRVRSSINTQDITEAIDRVILAQPNFNLQVLPSCPTRSTTSQSSARTTSQDVQERIAEFQASRRDAQYRTLARMAGLGIGLYALGVTGQAIPIFLVDIVPLLSVRSLGFHVSSDIGCWLANVGVLLLCTISSELDYILGSYASIRFAIIVACGGYSFSLGLQPWHWDLSVSIACIMLLFSGTTPYRVGRFSFNLFLPSTSLAILGLLTTLSIVGRMCSCAASCQDSLGVGCSSHCQWNGAGPAFVLKACWAAVGFVLMAVFYTWKRYAFFRYGPDYGCNPTMAFWEYSLCFHAHYGIAHCIVGMSFLTMDRSLEGVSIILGQGLPGLMPLIARIALGYEQLYRVSARLFEDQQIRRDSAFIATLLDGVTVNVGDDWWVHDDEGQEWQVGQVLAIGESEFMVRVTLTGEQNDSFKSPRHDYSYVSARSAQKDYSIKSPQRESSNGSHDTPSGGHLQRLAHMYRRQTSNSSGVTNAKLGPACVDHVIPLGGRGWSTSQLLDFATRNLRCIDWRNMSLELMDTCSECGRVQGSYKLSRPVRAGERIDFFLSHSWHDDPVQKWSRLEHIAETFMRKHGRYPTFWLDRVCIDQSNLADGLRVLPINIASCHKMIALVGETYAHRLWCIWEIFTVFAFASGDGAHWKIELVSMATGSSKSGLEGLLSFDLSEAHTYDPNEEMRLMRVIDTVGRRHFESRICDLSAACLKHMGADDSA